LHFPRKKKFTCLGEAIEPDTYQYEHGSPGSPQRFGGPLGSAAGSASGTATGAALTAATSTAAKRVWKNFMFAERWSLLIGFEVFVDGVVVWSCGLEL
jgi:hypothetical protein